MAYTKLDLLNEINALIERYVEQELAQKLPPAAVPDAEADILVELDADGDYIDIPTGDIWDLEKQCIIGHKDKTGQKTWVADTQAQLVSQESFDKLTQMATDQSLAEQTGPVAESTATEPTAAEPTAAAEATTEPKKRSNKRKA